MDNSIKQRISNINPIKIYFTIVIVGFIWYILYILLFDAGEKAFAWLGQFGETATAADFWDHALATKNLSTIYTVGDGDKLCFPPLAYLFYRIVYVLSKSKDIYELGYIDLEFLGHSYQHIFVYYNIFTTILWMIAIHANNKRKHSIKLEIAILIIVMLSIQSYGTGVLIGNAVLVIAAMLLIALGLRDSDNKVHRELALVIIAIAANFKLYPAIFGMLYLIEKRWKEALKLAIYGIVLFIVPFIWTGGIEGFKAYIGVLRQVSTYDGIMFMTNIQDVVAIVYRYFSFNNNYTLYKIVGLVFLVSQLVLAVLTKNKYLRIYFLCTPMALFLNKSYRYTGLYLFIPLILYIIDNWDKDITIKNKFETVILILAGLGSAIPMIWGILTDFEAEHRILTKWVVLRVNSIDIFIYAAIWIIEALLIIYCIRNIIIERKNITNT